MAASRSRSLLIPIAQCEWLKSTRVVDCGSYYKYSAIFHLEGLPPVCLLHGVDDELSPFSQSVELAEELERHGMPYEFYSYEGLKHYFSTSADNATTQQMFQDSLACLRRALASQRALR
jgi:dipeptidyl aminopeptidase/acylaminoacyl peptidase